MKPDTALNYEGEMVIPLFTEELHYELEVCLLVSKKGKDIPINQAGEYYESIGLGIDYTARDIQRTCKEKGHSWEIAKAFDSSAAMSTFFPKSNFDLDNILFELHQNGKVVQKGETKDMIFNIDYIIHHISKYFTIERGDIIMTGTPAGVGPVKKNDELQGFLEGELVLQNLIITK